MSKEQAMNVLGLGRSDGKKKPKQLADYTEDDLLEAFRVECSTIGRAEEQNFVQLGAKLNNNKCLVSIVYAELEGEGSRFRQMQFAYFDLPPLEN